MRDVKIKKKCLRKFLENPRFFIGMYQRQYEWQTKHLRDLLSDLCDAFLDSYGYEENDERSAIKQSETYFLGSIIILYENKSHKYIIHGQQRLITITLLLIYLKNKLSESNEKQKMEISRLICMEMYEESAGYYYGKEHGACIRALFNKGEFTINEECNTYDKESVQNMINRYSEIEARLKAYLNEDALPMFSDWLLQNVFLVEINAYTSEDAYTIFEIMNDRGLSRTDEQVQRIRVGKCAEREFVVEKLIYNYLRPLAEGDRNMEIEGFMVLHQGTLGYALTKDGVENDTEDNLSYNNRADATREEKEDMLVDLWSQRIYEAAEGQTRDRWYKQARRGEELEELQP